MSTNGKLLTMPTPASDPAAEVMAELRLQMAIDTKRVWNALVGLSCYAMNEEIQLAAQGMALAYTIGKPVERSTVEVTNRSGARAVKALADLSHEELKAIKVLQDAQKKRMLEEE